MGGDLEAAMWGVEERYDGCEADAESPVALNA